MKIRVKRTGNGVRILKVSEHDFPPFSCVESSVRTTNT